MKKMTILVSVAAILSLFAVVPVYAMEPTHIEGTFKGSSETTISERWAGSNLIRSVSSSGQYLTGPIVGTFEQTVASVRHYGVREPPARTSYWYNMKNVQEITGSVDGRVGTFVMHLNAEGSLTYPASGPPTVEVEGTWVIISGTGDLTSLHGQGTWRYDYAAKLNRYEGEIHFDP